MVFFNYNLIVGFIWDWMKKVMCYEYFVYSDFYIMYVMIMVIIIVLLFFFIFIMVYYKKIKLIGEKVDFGCFVVFLNEKGGNVLSYFGYFGDKWFYFLSDGNVFFLFGKIVRRLVVFGDLLG